MTSKLHIRPEAEDDIVAAFEWYESQLAGLGGGFLAELDQVLHRICDYPELHAAVYRDVRQTLVGRFPYVVAYLAEGGQIEVIAVFHAHRDPDIWRARVDG